MENEIIEKETLHAKRVWYLAAFDKYKTNVLYGIEVESEEQRKIILEWYRSILDLNSAAFSAIPQQIEYYL